MQRLLIASALVLTIAGCGKDDSKDKGYRAGEVGSCNIPSVQTCVEYRGANLAAGEDNLARLCKAAGVSSAEFTMTACPTEHVIGTCKAREGKDFIYEGYPMPVADFEAECKRKEGTFSTKP
jgi:hypothetical protein